MITRIKYFQIFIRYSYNRQWCNDDTPAGQPKDELYALDEKYMCTRHIRGLF